MTAELMPTIDDFRPVVLRVLSDGEERPLRYLSEQAADFMGMSEALRSELIPSGQREGYFNRIAWACSGLTQAGLLRRPKRGWYEITGDGRQVDARSLRSYTERDMLE